MTDVTYRFKMDQRVVTPFGDPGIIKMLGYDDGDIQYFVNAKTKGSWFKECELTEAGKGVLNG